jgi:hypothetical protein
VKLQRAEDKQNDRERIQTKNACKNRNKKRCRTYKMGIQKAVYKMIFEGVIQVLSY